jgi:hypothetical protein
MTIAAGFLCKDGVLLAADTEITFSGGKGKTYASKIFHVSSTNLNCYLTYAGSPYFAKELVHELGQALDDAPPSQSPLKTIKATYLAYLDEQFAKSPETETASVLVALREGTKVNLYLGSDRHFTQVRGYEVLGIGMEQAEALFNPLHASWMTIYEAIYMAIYALRRVKGFVQGCGGNSEILAIKDKPSFLGLVSFTSDEIKEIEEDFDFFDQHLRPLLFAVADLEVSRSSFQQRLTHFGGALKKRRAGKLRAHEREMERLRKLREKYESDEMGR